ncbi:saccharopine dehydrogenase C-terminal domain-containing protein [Candidatus Endomicrobiellum agilis]|uniref:saccharopine dehydrogenase C-terminal domain-containing protein n=1 Tax=Candidatus Endomicrobiellum agilis TaxID=3238957 RepID=UPI003586DD18|nr:saccharopine dehydrogenase family protein [Endomicrobium sp.]
MEKRNVLLVGAGGVAHVAAHKFAQNNDLFGNIYIASRSLDSCKQIIESIGRKNNYKDPTKKIQIKQIDALNVPEMIRLIKDLKISITVNLASAFCNMSILEACIETGSAYIDTAIHEEPNRVCENPPWYANYEWKRKDRCQDKCITAILGSGFDPGVVNSYAAYAKKHFFDTIDTIDIMDVNAGSHGKYFATNFDPEINFREFVKVWTWIDKQWVCKPVHSEKQVYNFPVVGKQTIYLTGHDELHSLSKNFDAKSIRFWMGFSDHYINCFNVLKNIGLLSEKPVETAEGLEVVPLKVVKACLPDPKTLAANYTGNTCIGDLIIGTKDGRKKELFIYNVCNHKACYEEVESQAISYTAGVPAVATAILIARGEWDIKKMVNVEELDPDPFIDLLKDIGLPTETIKVSYSKKSSKPSKK